MAFNKKLTLDGLKYYTTKIKNLINTNISNHNTSTSAHTDIRDLITGLTTRLNALADSDDTTLDQLSEIVAYIKANRSLIESITTNKVNVSDIIDNLTSTATNKPLSANQGKVLKDLINALTATDVGALSDTTKYAGSSTIGGAANSVVGTLNITDLTNGNAELKTYNGSSDLSITIPMNTDYLAGAGISLSGTTFSNSGVRSISTGTTNGTISVNTNGTSANVAVKGLGSAAYTASTDYMPKTWANNTLYTIGDDVSMGDGNVGGCLVIKGLNGATGIQFNPYSGSTSQKITIDGSGTMTITGTLSSTFSGALSGNASTATALTTSAGSATKPVYFSSGKPVACTYSLNKSVPSNAVFTDTWRGITTSLTSTSTSTSLAASAGKSLQDQITTLNSKLIWKTYSNVSLISGLYFYPSKGANYRCIFVTDTNAGRYTVGSGSTNQSEDTIVREDSYTGTITIYALYVKI